jgi:hypothetical protein
MADKSYIGKGLVYLDGRQVGNCTALNFQIAEEKIELDDYTSSGGGLYNSLTRIDSVALTMTLSDYNAENLAATLFGSSSAVTATTVTDESIDAPAALSNDSLVTTANVIDTDETVTVTSDPAGTTYVADTDYTVSAAGIVILTTGSISASDPLLISYTKKAVDVVQALTTSAQEYTLDFVGLNEAQSGVPVVVKVHRAKFGPAADLAMIGDEFAVLALTGDALKDTSITTAGLSQYLYIKAA